ncbi:MAG: PAS domain-containing sensor histidine kinase [Fibrobacterota bacterium]
MEKELLVVDNLNAPFLIIDSSWHVTRMNPAARQLLGFSGRKVLGEELVSLFPGVFETIPSDVMLQKLKERQMVELELRVGKQAGAPLYVHLSLSALGDSNGKPGEVLGLLCDMTAGKESREECRRIEERYTYALRVAGIGVWEWDLVSDTVLGSPEFSAIWGYSPGEFGGTLQEVIDRVHPEDVGKWRMQIGESLERGVEHNLEFRIVLPGGGIVRWVRAHGDLRRDAQGQAVKMIGVVQDITEYKLAEDKLRISDERYRSLMSNTSEGVFLFELAQPVDTDTPVDIQIEKIHQGWVAECNDAQAKMYGYDRGEQLVGKPLYEMLGKTVKEENRAFLTEWISNGYQVTGAVSSEVDRNGNPVWFSNNVIGIVENDRLVRIWGTQIDVTGMKKAEEQLRDQRWRLQSIIEGTNVGTWEWNVQSGNLVINEMWAGIIGYKLSELEPISIKVWERVTHPDDLEKSSELLKRHFAGQTPFYRCEVRMRHRDGHWVWVLDQGKVISRTPDGKPLMMFGTHTDVTERKENEQKVIRERDLSHAILESLPGIFYIFDEEGRYLRWNHSFEKVTGYKPREISRLHPLDLFLGEDKKRVAGRISTVFEVGAGDVEAVLVDKNGDKTVYYFTGQRTRLDGVICLVGMGIDISERKRAEARQNELKEKIEAWQKIMEYIIKYDPNAVSVLDKDLRYIFVSDRFKDDYNIRGREVIGKTHYEVFPEIPDKWRNVHEKALSGEVLKNDEDCFKRTDGTVDWVKWECRPWFESDGAVGGIILYTEVITGRKKVQEDLKASLKEKETLLQEIYHRTKNNMQVISSFLELQALSSGNEEVSRIIQDSTLRIRTMSLAHEMLYKGKSLSSISLKDYLTELVGLVAASAGAAAKRVQLRFDIDDIDSLIDIAIPCGLVVNELVSNSFKHAFPDDREGIVTVELHGKDENRLELVIADNGVGLPPGLDIFKTATLGVQLVVQIVRHQLHGSIQVESEGGVKWRIQFNSNIYQKRV